jgi:hypothetical protein
MALLSWYFGFNAPPRWSPFIRYAALEYSDTCTYVVYTDWNIFVILLILLDF